MTGKDKLKRGVGRPTAEEPRSHNVVVRLTEHESKWLDELCSRSGYNRSQIFRIGYLLIRRDAILLEDKAWDELGV